MSWAWLVDLFPLLVFVLLGGAGIATILLGKRVSRGSQDAGPLLVPDAPTPGLRASSWSLEAIEMELSNIPQQTRTSLVLLCRQLGLDPKVTSPIPTEGVLELVVRLEDHLEIKAVSVIPPQPQPSNKTAVT